MNLWSHLRELQEDVARTAENERTRTIDILVERITQVAKVGESRVYVRFDECNFSFSHEKEIRAWFRGNGISMRINYRHNEITLTIPEYDLVKHRESQLMLIEYKRMAAEENR